MAGGIGGDLAGLMSIMQRNKALREEKRQWDEGAEGRALVNEGQRLSNETAQDGLDREEARARLAASQERGSIDDQYRFNANTFSTLEGGGEDAHEATLEAMGYLTEGMKVHGSLEDNQRVVGYSKTSDGQVVLEIEYTDGPNEGMVAPLTKNGTSDDNDPVQPLSQQNLVDLAEQGVIATKRRAGGTEYLTLNATNTIASSVYEEQAAAQQNVASISNALNKLSGGKAASRAFISSISNMEPSERQKQIETVAADLGIELTPMPAPQELTPADIKVAGQPSEERSAPRGRLEIIGDREQDGRARREEARIAALPGKIERLRGNIALLEERGVSEDHISMRKNRESLAQAEADLASAGGDPVPPTPTGNPAVDYMATQRKITEALETMTPEQVASGDFSFITPEDRAATIGMLREREIVTARDIRKLPPKEQAMAWATLAAYAPSEGARTAATNNLRNITETGVASVSAKDLLSTTGNKGEDSITAPQAISNLNEYRKTHTDEDGNFDTAAFVRDANMLLSAAGQGSTASGVIQNEIAKQVQIALQEGANEGGRDNWFEGFINMFTGDALIDSSSVDFSNYRKVVDPKNSERILKVIAIGNDGKQKGGDINIEAAQQKLGTSIGLHLILDKMEVYKAP
jgi:hypothetical protein